MDIIPAIRLWLCLNLPWHDVSEETIADGNGIMTCSWGRKNRIDYAKLAEAMKEDQGNC